MICEGHILCFNEEDILPFTLRHYATFCDRIFLHDAQSTDRSRMIAMNCGAEIIDWETDGVNDMLAKTLKERSVMESRADWCIVADADELIYFPEGPSYSLGSYEAQGLAVVKPHGFEMVSDEFPTGDGQIYDQVTLGAPDDKWYAKPILTMPGRLRSIVYSAGAHQAWATLANGAKWHDSDGFAEPAAYLLHCHHLGPIDRIGRRYAGQQARHSKTNISNKWGNFADPYQHARDKRAAIMKRVQTVIG